MKVVVTNSMLYIHLTLKLIKLNWKNNKNKSKYTRLIDIQKIGFHKAPKHMLAVLIILRYITKLIWLFLIYLFSKMTISWLIHSPLAFDNQLYPCSDLFLHALEVTLWIWILPGHLLSRLYQYTYMEYITGCPTLHRY